VGSLLLLAATVWSFAHLLLGLSNHNKVVLWLGCESGARRNLPKKNMQWVRFIAKTRGYCCSLAVGVALTVWFSYGQYTKMTRDENVGYLDLKSCDISTYWWISMLAFLLNHIWIRIDYFLLNFFATFGSIFGLQITVTFGSVLGLQVTVRLQVTLDCSHRHVGSHLLQAQCCVVLRQLKKESNRQSSA